MSDIEERGPEEARPEPSPAPGAKREGIGFKGWLMIVSAGVLIVFVVINSQRVTVDLLFATVHLPLIVALLIAALLGALLGWAVPRVRRSGE